MKLLNKTFYKFALGFIAIITLSLFIVTVASYYENLSVEEVSVERSSAVNE